MIDLIQDDGRDIGNTLWIENCWEKHVAQIFTPNLNDHLLTICNALSPLLDKVTSGSCKISKQEWDWDKTILGYETLIQKFETKSNKTFKVLVRDIFLEEKNVIANMRPICAGLLDFVLLAYHSTNIVLNSNQKLIFIIPNFSEPTVKIWWNTLRAVTERELQLPKNSLILK